MSLVRTLVSTFYQSKRYTRPNLDLRVDDVRKYLDVEVDHCNDIRRCSGSTAALAAIDSCIQLRISGGANNAYSKGPHNEEEAEAKVDSFESGLDVYPGSLGFGGHLHRAENQSACYLMKQSLIAMDGEQTMLIYSGPTTVKAADHRADRNPSNFPNGPLSFKASKAKPPVQ